MQNSVGKEKNPRISDSIVSYFWNHGHNRGIEKFLKLRSRSNSDTSVSNLNNIKHKSMEKLTKSLENVSDSTVSYSKDSKTNLFKKELVDENFKSNKLLENIDKTSDNNNIKVSVKQNSEKNTVKNKSPYNFNVESIIEINMPTSILQQVTKGESIENLKSIVCSESQTSNAMVSIEELPESTSKFKNNLLAVSPSDSSVASISNKQMEWDALADIGYEKYSLCNANELDDSEIKALKTYFYKQGKSFDEKVVVLRNKKIDLQQEYKKMDDEEHKHRLSVIKKNREKWQNIYDKYKEKYQQTKLDFTDVLPSTSTPKLILQKKDEKSSQTSLIKNSSRSTQVNREIYSPNMFSRNFIKSDSELINVDESVGTEIPHDSETAASFEFIAIEKQKKSSKEKRIKHSMTASSSSFASTNNSINMSFNEELQLAITLLKSLLDSKNMNSELKKNLASKIIQKIIRTQTSRSMQTSTIDQSENIKINSCSFSNTSEEKFDNSKISQTNQKENNPSRSYDLKEFLQPQTNSEMEHQRQSIEIPKKLTLLKNKSKSSKESSFRLSRPHYNRNLNLIAYVKRAKISQLNWIENEIDHLNSLKELLVINEDNSSTNTNQKSEMTDDNILYENVASSIDQFTARNIDKLILQKQHNKKINKFNWDSHVNIKKYGKNRSKLETPENSVQSNKGSSNYRTSKYQKSSEKIKPPSDIDTNLYSEAKEHKKQTNCPSVDLNASTSLASSEVFVSSESISISNEIENSNCTTHHRGDLNKEHHVLGTQTNSNSVLKNKPMFISKEKKRIEYKTVTTNIEKMINNKKKIDQKQSIMYTLTFDKKDCFKIEKKFSSLPQHRATDNTLSFNVKVAKEINNRMNLNSLNRQNQEDKVSSTEEIVKNVEYIELENCLNERRPKLFQKFEERNKCIQELKKLRY